MATLSPAPGAINPQAHPPDTLSTIPDPRTPLTPPELSRSNSTSPQHPGLSNEVAALSNKLIHAINHQTDLDDTLNDTRQQLEAAQEQLRVLEKRDQEHQSLVDNRILVKWEEVENDTLRLRTNLADERRRRVQAENERKSIEQELENLTTSLFEEANQMVAAAKKDAQYERESLHRRNEQLQVQLRDSETLLASHQEQLAELKQAVSDLSVHRTEGDGTATMSTAPTTPALDGQEHISRLGDASNMVPTAPGSGIIAPAPPTHFSHLISPVLRSDVPASDDFHSLMELARRSGASSRVTSGNYSGFSGLGLSNLGKSDQSQLASRLASNGSNTSLSASTSLYSPSSTANVPPSNNTSGASRELPTAAMPLKETAFYKRALVEDIEPTLRLDTAPGLSWLARRGVISSMCDGKLIVEPMPSTMRGFHQPCSLCGEQSHKEKPREHRFRTNESETAQRYPLCEYCLNRVRSTCDFLGFLRMVKDGHWRIDGAQAESLAWEESVRLRERMFWSRIGGGVVPAFVRTKPESSQGPEDTEKPSSLLSESLTSALAEEVANGAEVQANEEASSRQNRKIPTATSPNSQLKQRSADSKSISNSDAEETALTPAEEPENGGAYSTSREPSGKRPSYGVQRSGRKSQDPSGIESSGQAISSIAKRAAMFERSSHQDVRQRESATALQTAATSKPPNR